MDQVLQNLELKEKTQTTACTYNQIRTSRRPFNIRSLYKRTVSIIFIHWPLIYSKSSQKLTLVR